MEEDIERGGMNSELTCKKSNPRKVVAAYQNLSNIVSLPKVALETQALNPTDESELESEIIGEESNSVEEDSEK